LKKTELIFLTVALVLAAVIGGLIGDITASFIPEGGVKTLFEKNIRIGLQEPFHLNFYALEFTFGLLININFVSVLLVIGVLIYYRWWYI